MSENNNRIQNNERKSPEEIGGGKIEEKVITTHHSGINEDAERERFSITTGVKDLMDKYNFRSEDE